MKRIFNIAFVFAGLCLLLATQLDAQLVTDSDRRLKTQKSKPRSNSGSHSPSKSPFAAFNKKKVKTRSASSRRPFKDYQSFSAGSISSLRDKGKFFQKASSGVRTASGSPFASNRKFSGPRYSSGSYWSKRDLSVSPRFSSGSPFRGYKFKAQPRFSQSKRWTKQDMFVSPRYSATNIWSKKDRAVNVRYSKGHQFSDLKWFSPRFSVGHEFSDLKFRKPRYSSSKIWSYKDVKKDIRYSQGHEFSDLKWYAPRYSATNVWSKKDKQVHVRYSKGNEFSDIKLSAPRYSLGHEFSDLKFKTPRYTAGNPYKGYKYLNIPPRYSTNKDRFEFVEQRFRIQSVHYQPSISWYQGDNKAKWKRAKNMHPSYQYHRATQSSDFLRESMRKWNIVLTRFNGNQVDPKPVREKVHEPKFDRKEAKIWNE